MSAEMFLAFISGVTCIVLGAALVWPRRDDEADQ